MIPLVSVIVPIYNSEEFITETIESIINQSYKNLEIIYLPGIEYNNTKYYTLSSLQQAINE